MKNKNKSKYIVIGYVVLGILLVAIIIFALIYYMKNRQDEREDFVDIQDRVETSSTAPLIEFSNSENYYNKETFNSIDYFVKVHSPNNSEIKKLRYEWTDSDVNPEGITDDDCTGGIEDLITKKEGNEVLSKALENRPNISSDSHFLHVCVEDITGQRTKSQSQYYLDTKGPENGYVRNTFGYQKPSLIEVNVRAGYDEHSGMSTNDSDYYLEVASASLNNVTGECGPFTPYRDANVDEKAKARTYDFAGKPNNCYKFRYTVKDNVGNTTIYTGQSITKIDSVAPE